MSIIDSGRYRLRKDWASVSIPSLVDIVEQTGDNGEDDVMPQNVTSPSTVNVHQIKLQAAESRPRRSSLALSLFSNKTEKSQKRRSSIATTFFKRDHNKKNATRKESSANVNNEKNDDSNSPECFSSDENIPTSSPNESMKIILENNLNSNDGISAATTTYTDDIQINEPPERYNNRGRRSSLQLKLDRRRRKNFESTFHTPQSSRLDLENFHNIDVPSMASASSSSLGRDIALNHTAYYPKEKRHSWWNIFIPDNIKHRSRRASQDVTTISRSFDNLPVRRSKSRSVDHGLAAPFDLDMLRSKVEERFETVDRLNERKKSSLPTIPTINYTVGNRDTLTSVAARFDTTPSELTQLNRLNSSFIYPGQQLLVPDKNAQQQQNQMNPDNDNSDVKSLHTSSTIERKLSADNEKVSTDILESLRPGSPKPGRIERVDVNCEGNNNNKNDDPVITQRFLKINVRHITDGQGVVGGVLLVTPNAVMFDPNVSDPLVIEHGPESYGVIAPMELCVNAAIFLDIAHMRVSGDFTVSSLADTSSNLTDSEKQEIYYPKAVLEQKQHQQDQLQQQQSQSQQLESQGGEQTIEHDTKSSDKSSDILPPSAIEHITEDNQKIVDQTKDGTEAEIIVGDSTSHRNSITVIGQVEDDNKAAPSSLPPTSSSTLDERRKSLLDHHWAIPSKDRSSEDEGDNESNATMDSGARGHDGHSASSSMCGALSGGNAINTNGTTTISAMDPEQLQQLSKQTCYDSGIDIRDPIPNIQPIPKKTVYSDADIVLSSDWVPPKAISPAPLSESPPRSANQLSGPLETEGGGGGGLCVTSASVGHRKKTSSVSFSVDDNNEAAQSVAISSTVSQADKTADKKNKMLKRLSYPLTWVEGLTGEGSGAPTATSTISATNNIGKSLDTESAPNTADSNQSVFSKVFSSSPITLVSELSGNLFSKTPSEDSSGSPVPPLTPHSTHSEGHVATGRSSIGTFMRSESASTSQLKGKDINKSQPKLDYRSMVSVDDKPELFVSVDKLIPRPARACPDPPLYLRLRMGKPIGRTVPLPTSVMSYGKNKLRPEYWFSVPKNRVDELYRFMNTWVPHLYGKLDEDQIKSRGFELIQDNTEWTHNDSKKSGSRSNSFEGEEISDLTRESWELIKAPFAKTYNIIKTASHAASQEMDILGGEVLSMSNDEYRKTAIFQTGSFDLDFPIPDLIGNTEILTEEHREKLCGHLPARAEGYSWSLIFSTSQHGFSLKSLYRKMQRLESPILIVIQDTEHNVFGALTSCALHVSDHFYGTGESLLYKFKPNFKVFHWTGENLYFIKGNPESLSIGAGDGRFGLWLDGDLNQGRSQSCSTYGNEPLAPQEDFVIKTLECWAFV